MPAFKRPHSDRAPSGARLRTRLGAEDGLTLIEVVVTGLMVGLISLSLIGLDAVGKTTADQRRRTQAFQVAQADQERIKGLSADQIATLNQTRTVTLDNVAYTVTSTGQYLSSSANSASCSSAAAAADYAKVISTVSWAANRRADIVVQSVVTPRAGGSLLTQTVDQSQNPLPGVRIDVAGADPSTDAVRRFGITDSGGCTIFGTLLVGDYTVAPTLAGYVDKDGDSTPQSTVTTTAGNTTTVPFTLGQAGKIVANFQTTIGSNTYAGQYAPALSWSNTLMTTPGFLAPGSPATAITTAQALFPFATSGPTGPYTVWSGKCATAMPTVTANQTYASMGPGATVNLTGSGAVKTPALIVKVSYKATSTSTAVRVKPAQVKLTDSCGQSWYPPLASAAIPSPDNGALSFPGQPSGTYPTVCADYNGYKATASSVAITNFTAGTTVNLTITNGVSPGTC